MQTFGVISLVLGLLVGAALAALPSPFRSGAHVLRVFVAGASIAVLLVWLNVAATRPYFAGLWIMTAFSAVVGFTSLISFSHARSRQHPSQAARFASEKPVDGLVIAFKN